ncbi:MAG: AAA family ATPase [Sporichthyaceae bacterium]
MTQSDLEQEGFPTTEQAPLITTPFALGLAHVVPDDIAETVVWQRARGMAHWRDESLLCPLDPAAIFPEGARVLLQLAAKRRTVTIVEGASFIASVIVHRRSTHLFVAARTAEVADAIVAAARLAVPPPASTTAAFTLWRLDKGEAVSWKRDLDVPDWSQIAHNYPDRAALDALMELSSVSGTGRLMLWTGAPGTGKTFAIRALARAWNPWCSAHLVIDPERFFGDAAYLIEVMAETSSADLDDDGEEMPAPRARLIICEDADDFIRDREKVGPGLGRLLNVADGLLGQGLNNIILLTSNTPVTRLDPALVRPGRLLANIEFGPFTPAAAREWLHEPGAVIPAEGQTLAELYERAGSTVRHRSAVPQPVACGAYL